MDKRKPIPFYQLVMIGFGVGLLAAIISIWERI